MSFYAELPLQELSELVARHPDEIDLRLAMVEHFVRHDQFEDALSHACMAEDLTPGNPDVEMWKSMCLIFNGEMEDGHELLQRVIRNNPCGEFQMRLITEIVPLFTGEHGDPSAVSWMGGLTGVVDAELNSEFAQRTSSFMDAVNLLQESSPRGIAALEFHIERFPDDVNARLYLAIAYCGVQRLNDAARLYRQVIEQDGQCSTAYFDLAAIVPDPEESIRLTRLGLQHCPFAVHARYNLGMFMMQLRRYQDARYELSRIPADNSIYADALVAIGMSWEDEFEFTKAAEALERAVILQPERADIRGKYGQLLCDCGWPDKALVELEYSLQLDENQYCVWANLGLLHLRASQYDKALMALQKSLDLNPQSEDAAINLAVLLAETGNIRQGIEILEDAVHYHPENALICQNLGAFYCNKKDLEQALFYTDRAIELGVDSPAIYWNMANIYCFKDNRERCLEYLGRAIERDHSYAAQFLIDEDFRKYQNDPEFIALARSVD